MLSVLVTEIDYGSGWLFQNVNYINVLRRFHVVGILVYAQWVRMASTWSNINSE